MDRFAMNQSFAMQQQTHSEVIAVPDRMVGLIIGKGGEQITSIQAESECRVQFAQGITNAAGLPERPCTLTGTAEAIRKAKELISRIMNKGHDMLPDMSAGDGQTMIELMIPGNKAGIIIGKGGETIKTLQEQAGVRMVVIQENNSPTNYDKPLRITGDRASCQKAKEMVMQLLAEKDMQLGGFQDYGGHRTSVEIAVPRSMIGIVIGKGGEMIKKIQQDSGARIQFRPEDETGGPARMCNLTGSHEQTQAAASMIQELIDNTARQGGDAGWGRGRGMTDISRPGGRVSDGFRDETTYSVPAEKCGLVIGKGGETIREICRQSGAHVELNRDQSLNQLERIFRIQGSPEQVQSAIRLICEKAGITPTRDVSTAHLVMPGPALGNINGQMGAQQQQQQPMQQILQQNFGLQSWTAAPQYQQYGQPTAADAGKPAAIDPNTAAWAAYYQQLYSQLSVPQSQQTIQAIAAQQPSLYGAPARTTVTPQPSINPHTGQLDYSAAWADYYRQQGMHQHAQAILQAASGQIPQ